MNEHWLWYIAGAMDTGIRISVRVMNNLDYKLEYSMRPVLTYSRPSGVESIFGMMTEYMEKNVVKHRIDDLNGSTQIVVENPESVRRFLEPILPGLVQQRERAEIMFEEFLPLVEDGSPNTKDEFIDAIEVADKIRDKPIRSKRPSKYDADYFRGEWG